MITRILFTLLCLYSITSCQNNSRHTIPDDLKVQFPIEFESSNISTVGLSIQSGLRANLTGDSLLWFGQITNNRETAIKIMPCLLQLHTLEQYRNNTVSKDSNQIIAANKSQSFSFLFAPINNKLLYHQTGNKGALDTSYSINLNFIREVDGQKISNQDINYQLKKEEIIKHKVQIQEDSSFTFYQIKKNQKSWEQQVKYLQKVKQSMQSKSANPASMSTASFTTSQLEFLIDGLILNTKFYHVNNSIYLNLTLINHSHSSICFSPDSIQIVGDHKVFTKKNAFDVNVKQSCNKSYILHKGERYHNLFCFGPCKSPPSNISADFSSICYYPQNKKFFAIQANFAKVNTK